jgi:hypothetical protein
MGLADTRDPNSLSTKLRRRRDVKLRALISKIAEGRDGIAILDMGGTVEYWERLGVDFLRSTKAKVTIVNRYAGELTSRDNFADVFSSEVGDACDLSEFQSGSFDLVHSNSVIEHVETWPNMKSFARETRRLADNYYVQTPYFWFPIDPHYYKMPLFHWLPRPVRASLLLNYPIAHAGRASSVDSAYEIVDRARLLDRRQFQFLFPDAELKFERVAGLPKSMVAIRSF